MSSKSLGIFVSCTSAAVFVRVVGRGACRNSEPLREFGLKKLSDGYRKIYIDLLECDGVDSTFLGVFAGLGLALQGIGSLTLINLKGETLKAFQNLGLDHVAAVEPLVQVAEAVQFPAEATFEKLPGSDLTAKECRFDAVERAVLMLECHEDLCRIDERNEEKFRDVKEFLREDIARHLPEKE